MPVSVGERPTYTPDKSFGGTVTLVNERKGFRWNSTVGAAKGPWQMELTTAVAPNTTDHVLATRYNWDPVTGTRYVDDNSVRFGYESTYEGAFEWNLDLSPASGDLNMAAPTRPWFLSFNWTTLVTQLQLGSNADSNFLLTGYQIINGNTRYGRLGQTLEIDTVGTSGGQALNSWVNDATARSILDFNKSRGVMRGTYTIIQANDQLGYIGFRGADGVALIEAAAIKGEVDGTPGANDMPGRLVFMTTPDGSATPVEAMRISKNQAIEMTGPQNLGSDISQLRLTDTAAYNTTPGGALQFRAKYDTDGNISQMAAIRGIKENTTSGNYASALVFYTRLAGNSVAERMRITSTGDGQFADGFDFIFGTSTGHQIGTAANQKIGFWGHAPAVQPTKAGHNDWAALSDVVAALVSVGIFDAA